MISAVRQNAAAVRAAGRAPIKNIQAVKLKGECVKAASLCRCPTHALSVRVQGIVVNVAVQAVQSIIASVVMAGELFTVPIRLGLFLKG